MPPSWSTVCDWLDFMIHAFMAVSVVVLLAPAVYPNLSSNVSIVEEIWTAKDLSSMAGSSTMVAALSFLTGGAHKSGAPALTLAEIKALIDGRTAADIRTAIFKVSDGRITNNFDKFARNTNAAATCSTAGTAGADGVDACLAGCEQKRSFLAWTPSKGACYMLCALATSPCTKDIAGTTTKRTVSWGTMAMGWGETITSVVHWILMVVFPLSVVQCVYAAVEVRAHKTCLRELEKQLEMLKLDEVAIDRELLLLDEALLHALQDLAARLIDGESQPRAQDGELLAAPGARLRREEGSVRLFRGRD